jgi:hypothetical protein
MSEGPFPKTIPEAIPWITWGAVIFTFFLVFVEKLVESAYGQALSALIGGGIVTAVALHSKTWLEKTNPNWAFAAALALLFAIIASPWIEQKHWPFSAWFNGGVSVEAQKSTLIDWLQQAQRERDDVRRELDGVQHERDEAKQAAVATEAQKKTLVEWLQEAQRLSGTASTELTSRPFVTYPLHAPAAATSEQECVNLAHRLADLNPSWASDKVEIEHIRSTMTGLGCGCGASKK